jgi:RNA 2',3'-cyclic 3'-phosphodiesterase
MTRLFVAVTPPAAVVEALAAAVARARPAAPGLRWVDLGGAHLTLVFLGEVADELRAGLDERLARVARGHASAPVRLEAPGQFDDRVLWAGVGGDLAALAVDLRHAATQAGVAGIDPRPLRAHLTLAYARAARRAGEGREPAGGMLAEPDSATADLGLARAALEELPALTWTVDGVALMSSARGRRPVYAVETSWRLGATRVCSVKK